MRMKFTFPAVTDVKKFRFMSWAYYTTRTGKSLH